MALTHTILKGVTKLMCVPSEHWTTTSSALSCTDEAHLHARLTPEREGVLTTEGK